jgi:phosphoribosyl 1,2-cyclic phosphodiesterase
MKRLGLSMNRVKAVIISHEHGDHIHGVTNLSKKFKLPVYITPKTYQHGNLQLSEDRTVAFQPQIPFSVGALTITPFPKFHDAADAHSFVISHSGVNVGVFTDIGLPCQHVIHHFKQCHAAFLESNYDEQMLEDGRYPSSLKNRIRGGKGHLSNKQAAQLFTKYRPSFMSHLFLSHLSRNNNTPGIVKDLFVPLAGKTEIIIASRNKETRLYHIRNTTRFARGSSLIHERVAHQLSLFG